MKPPRLRFVSSDVDRFGRRRFYVRQPGRRKIRINERYLDDSGAISAEFLAAYHAALAQSEAEARAPKPPPREETFAWLIDQFYRDAAFRGLGAETQKVRRRILDHFTDIAGGLPYRKFRRQDAERAHFSRRATPGAADNWLKAVRRLFSWALEKGFVTANPTTGIKKIHKSDGHHAWSPAEIDRFRAHFPIGTRPRLALELMLSTGARRSDAVRLGRQHESNGWLRFTAAKNRERHPVVIEVPIQPTLRAALDATATGDLTYVCGDRGLPLTPESFGNMFREWCSTAGLPHCSAHGLRKASAIALAEHGATASELCSVFGWSKLETAEIYVRAASRRRMSGNAFARLDDYRKAESVPLSPSETRSGTKTEKTRGKSTPK